MGCFCSNPMTNRMAKQSNYTSLSTNSPSFSFSHPNECFFLIPKNFYVEVSQLKDIIVADPLLWKNYINFLTQIRKSFHEKIKTIEWFLNRENSDNQSSMIDNSDIENGSPRLPFIISQISISTSTNAPKNIFLENFPFMKTHSFNNFRTKLIIEIESLILSKRFLPTHPFLEDPFIEIEIHSYSDDFNNDEKNINIFDRLKQNSDEVIKLKSNKHLCFKHTRSSYWNEFFSQEILNVANFEQGFFTIALYFNNTSSKKKVLIGEKYIFEFSELGNQLVMEKILTIKESNDEIACYLLFKCQLVFDIQGLLLFWKNDLEVKSEVAKRILFRIHNQSRYSVFPSKKCKSLIFSERKMKEDLQNMMQSFHKVFNSTLNESLRRERISFKEAYKRTFASKMVDSMISQESALLNQSLYYDNKYYVA